jgi:phage shock protein E
MIHRQRPARRIRIALVVAVGALGISACGGTDTATPVADAADETTAGVVVETPAFGLVSPRQASELSTTEGVTVIDVRTPEEFAEGHIDGATMIDFYADTFADEIGALDQDGTYLVYCRSGNRSGQTASLMRQLGFQQVYDLDGGIIAYGQSGLPLVR